MTTYRYYRSPAWQIYRVGADRRVEAWHLRDGWFESCISLSAFSDWAMVAIDEETALAAMARQAELPPAGMSL